MLASYSLTKLQIETPSTLVPRLKKYLNLSRNKIRASEHHIYVVMLLDFVEIYGEIIEKYSVEHFYMEPQ